MNPIWTDTIHFGLIRQAPLTVAHDHERRWLHVGTRRSRASHGNGAVNQCVRDGLG